MCAKCFHAEGVSVRRQPLHAAVSAGLNEPSINASAGQVLVDFQESVQSLFQMS